MKFSITPVINWLVSLFTRNKKSLEIVADLVLKTQLNVTDEQIAKAKELVTEAEEIESDKGETKKAKVAAMLKKTWVTLEPLVIDCLIQHAVMLIKRSMNNVKA